MNKNNVQTKQRIKKQQQTDREDNDGKFVQSAWSVFDIV